MASAPPGPPPGPVPGPTGAGGIAAGAPAGATPTPPAAAPKPGGPPAPGGATGLRPQAQNLMQGVLAIGKQIEQTLLMFAQAMPKGAQLFQQANDLIKQGLATEMAAAAGGAGEVAPAVSPTEVGAAPFAGGGFTSGGRP